MFTACSFLCSGETGYNVKKKTFTYCEKSEVKRQEYVEKIAKIPAEKCAYVAECGINTYLQREYGRALHGKKVGDTKRGRKFQRMNIIGAKCIGKHFALKCYKHTTYMSKRDNESKNININF